MAQGVVDGISAYGNAIGVPNIAGDLYFDERFDDNCLVNVVAMGIVKESDVIHSYAPPPIAAGSAVRRFRRSFSTKTMPNRTKAQSKFPTRS